MKRKGRGWGSASTPVIVGGGGVDSWEPHSGSVFYLGWKKGCGTFVGAADGVKPLLSHRSTTTIAPAFHPGLLNPDTSNQRIGRQRDLGTRDQV